MEICCSTEKSVIIPSRSSDFLSKMDVIQDNRKTIKSPMTLFLALKMFWTGIWEVRSSSDTRISERSSVNGDWIITWNDIRFLSLCTSAFETGTQFKHDLHLSHIRFEWRNHCSRIPFNSTNSRNNMRIPFSLTLSVHSNSLDRDFNGGNHWYSELSALWPSRSHSRAQ
jgi:hypothetical protein